MPCGEVPCGEVRIPFHSLWGLRGLCGERAGLLLLTSFGFEHRSLWWCRPWDRPPYFALPWGLGSAGLHMVLPVSSTGPHASVRPVSRWGGSWCRKEGEKSRMRQLGRRGPRVQVWGRQEQGLVPREWQSGG